jgi:hypothetical protein
MPSPHTSIARWKKKSTCAWLGYGKKFCLCISLTSTAARLKRMSWCYSSHGERRVLYLSCCPSCGKKLVLPCYGNSVQPFLKKTCRCSLVQRNKIFSPRIRCCQVMRKELCLGLWKEVVWLQLTIFWLVPLRLTSTFCSRSRQSLLFSICGASTCIASAKILSL